MVDTSIFYLGTCVCLTASFLLGELLSIRWRRRLTCALHTHYFHHDTFYQLGSLQPSSRHSQQGFSVNTPESSSPGSIPSMAPPPRPDNPDQRMTDDVHLFCASLTKCFEKCANTPCNVVLYSYLTYTVYESALPILVAVVFFIICAAVHRLVVSAIASAVYRFEAAEGDFRSAHMRVRGNAAEIAAWGGAGVEEVAVDAALASTLTQQLHLSLAYSVQTFVSKVCSPLQCMLGECCACM